ncbi:MAG: PAS domain S-box protein [Bacteroidota bacterium]
MVQNVNNMRSVYESILKEFLADKGESSLERAYEFGKNLIAQGLGCLDLIKIHEETIVPIVQRAEETGIGIETVRLGFRFLTESLSPFEMTHRGFYDVIEELKKQANELSEINAQLQSEIKVRKETELRLSNSEKKYRSLIETAKDVIYTLSPDGIITSLNPIFETLTGWKRDEWLGQHFAPLVHQDDLPFAAEILEKIMQGENPPIFELRIRTKENGYMIGEFITTPRYQAGQIIGALGIARDITARKVAERRLLESEHQLSTAQQIAHIGSWEWDITANTVHWSDELYRIYGLLPGQVETTYESYIERVHPEDQPIVRRNVERALQERKPFRSEYRIVHPDGTVRTVEGRGEAVLDDKNRIIKLRGTCQDITEHKLADEAVRSLAKRVVEAQENERRRIARDLHDNICQRLSAVKLHLSAMETEIKNKRSKKYVQVQDLKRQIGRTIKEVRGISIELRPTTLDDLGLPVALQLLCREFEKTFGIAIQCSIDGVEKEMFDAHRETALYRIAQEGLMNIAKHAQAKKVTLSLAAQPASVTMTIQDNGKGFDQTKLSTRKDGSGFGIMNMKERALLLGGSFKITSEKYNGTTLYLEIPLLTKAL